MNRREFIRNTSLAASSLGMAPTATWAADAKRKSKDDAIDRHALVTRHNVILNAYDRDTPLRIGNGSFAFAMDATGLQSFADDLGTCSDWA